MHRRTAVKASLAALLPFLPRTDSAWAQGAQDSATAPGLYDPSRVGRPRDRVTDYENDPFIVSIENRLRCTCGCNLDVYTCRTTDFTCGVSPAMHGEVVQLVEQGKTAQEVLDSFVALHGEMVLMSPRKQGFNLAAYFVPGAAISLVGAALVWMLVRRRQGVAAEAAVGRGSALGLSPEDRARLDDELSRLER